MTLFANTGIQIMEMPYLINIKEFQSISEAGELFRLIENSWTQISFDQSVRDYARIFWRLEERGSETDLLRPILAVDTTIGEGNNGFLITTDVGRPFDSKKIENIFTDDLIDLWSSWFETLKEKKGDFSSNNWVKLYLDFLEKIISKSFKGNSVIWEDENSIVLEEGMLGGFILKSLEESPQEIPVNLYLDLGNTRTTGIIYEDNPAQFAGFNPYHKLRLYNYKGYFDSLQSESVPFSDEVFPSLIEFRKSPFPDRTTSKTFNLLSLSATGVEAFNLKTNFKNKSGRFTGMSAPKRYLWDGELFHSSWFFSDQTGEKIQGELLKYMSLGDKDELSTSNVQRPVNPAYPRRTGMIFFLVEILEQVIRQINSPSYQEHSLPGRARVLSRVTISYPTAFSKTMKKRLEKQLGKAISIISEKYSVVDDLSFGLGIDEAATVQSVFLQTQVENLKSRFSSFINSTSFTSQHKTRIASIDIGGGTTDMMVAEYDTRDFHSSHRLRGEILDVDGVQYGGDDIVRTIIDEIIIEKILKGQDEKNEKLDELFRKSDDNSLRNVRLNFIYLVSRPIAIAYLLSLSDGDVKKKLKSRKSIFDLGSQSLGELISNPSPNVFQGLKNQIKSRLGDEAEQLIGENYDFSVVSDSDIEKIITNSPLVKNYLKSFSEKISKYNPSYVLLAGKLSEIPIIRDRLSLLLPTSPDRIVSMANYETGKWYPFNKDGKITDPKTTVSIGLSISDIAQHSNQANGLSVYIRENEDLYDQSFYLLYKPTMLMDSKDLIMKAGDDESKKIRINSDTRYIYSSRYSGTGKVHGSPQYEITLKDNLEEYPEEPPVCTLIKEEGELKINENSLEGKIKEGEEIRDCILDDIVLRLKTIVEGNYYLDTGIV